MFKSITIPWKGLAVTVILSLLVVACAPAAQSPTTGLSELATPASGTGAEQVPTAEVGQAQTQPTESVAQAPTTEAATEAPTTAAATEAATTEAPTTEAATPSASIVTEAPTTAAGAAAPTVAATAESTATPEATVASSAAVTATTPAATAVSTPSTLPVTGASDDGTAALSLVLIALGVVLLFGVLGLAFARREH